MLGKYKLGLRFKVAFALSALLFLSLFTTGYTSYQQSKQIAENKAIELQQSQLKLLKIKIKSALNEHQNILMSLRDTPPIQAIIDAIKNNGIDSESNESLNVWQQRLNTIFYSFLNNHSQYLQVRYIKSNGEELVRVERKANNHINIASQSELQNKSAEKYVMETTKMRPGQVYYSDVNLNKEYGKIQTPHVPVLRIATPVHNALGEVKALVIINLSTDVLFSNVVSTDHGIRSYIVDQSGNYIKHKDKSKSFAKEQGLDYNFYDIEPQWAERTKNNEELMQLNENSTEIFGFQKIFFAPHDHKRYWLLAIHIPEEIVFSEIKQALDRMIVIHILIAILSVMLIFWFVSKRILYPILTLASSAKKLHHGDLSIRLDPKSVKDEFRLLYYLMNNFAESQQNSTLKLEQKIAAQNKRLSAVIDNVVDAIITIDAYGKIESFNRAATTIFGYSEDEVIGKNVKMLMPDPYQKEHDGYLAHHNKTGEKKIIGIGREVTGKRKNNSTFPMELAVSEVSLDDTKYFVGIVRDITERKRIELMQKEFISTVSHELRTPLTSISGSLGLMLGGVTGELPEKAKELLVIANNNSESLIHLINDILDIEKMSAGKMSFDLNVTDITPVILNAIEANKGYGEKLNVSFTFSSTHTAPLMVNIDEKRIEQVMSNLLSNAAKYSPTHEVVTITLEVLADEVHISVHDQGKGIPKPFRAHIFDKFSQADSSDTRQKGGTGLGLHITKAIVKEHNGRIDFSCDKGNGTTFRFTLPLYTETPLVTDNNEKTNQKALILIIEDNIDIARLLSMMIKNAGYNCHHAYDYQQAKDLIATNQYDAVTLDLIIPGGDGLTLLKELRSKEETRKLPVIVVASPNEDSDKVKASDSIELVDWLEKPIQPEQLVKSIRTSLATKKQQKHHILHVEDDSDIITIVSSLLSNNYHIKQVSTLTEAKQLIAQEQFDLILLDIGLPDGSGLDLLHQLNDNDKNIPVVIFSAHDIPVNIARQVIATLTKSQTDNNKLIEKIHAVIHRKHEKPEKLN
ncbi:response regulator [Pseudocolwellia agarivorans]|uniref:response regulator n=1 Tax=Pseudocolwellia agarivorans TaxID=1911682 RepID=UPI0009868EF3|nr:response regulator [Pseudocolwellia agarivorans]